MRERSGMRGKEVSLTRGIVCGSLLCSVALALILVLMRTKWMLVFLGLLLITIILWFLIPYLHKQNRPFEWLLGAAVLSLLVIAPELALRIADFRFESRIEFGYPRPVDFVILEPDEELFWRLRPSAGRVNSLGFYGEEVAVPKPDGVFRMVFLGDSVVQQGYPEMVESFLSIQHDDSSYDFESVVLALSGYSSYQGVVLARKYGAQLTPDLVLVHFGWNDHWQAYGSVDAEKEIKVSRTVWNRVSDLGYRNIRALQAANWILVSLMRPEDTTTGDVRVPLNQYRENLQHLASVFREQSVPVILITAPTAHYRLGVPDYLVEEGFTQDKATAVGMHREYNQAVRDAAQADGLYLLDLDAELSQRSTKDLERLFTTDGIHLTEAGVGVIARRVSEFIEGNVMSPSDSSGDLVE